MIIHCTQKLAAKLPDVSAAPLAENSPLGSWHAHLYTYDRRQCVMFCHDASRYCLFLAGLVKADFAELGRLHRELFLATLIALNVPPTLLGRLTLALGPVQFDRNTNRSVLGSLRTADIDLSWLIQDLHVLDCNPVAVALELNERLTSVKGKYFFPAKEMLGRIHDLGGKDR
ncbi:hypothetical protein DSOUD_1977 [Desulfuromonas soudanensis]|uniref:DUF6933 domain-containing protein n=1 Tax=Desulfuromonas soudanensis TaxID=1603606 RepID=A0A0M4D1N5_9BACT|nr:hypothetical protein [Desulfuromonas soudanensis]ALC16746.1 hypothetical protein DSOUD_1977 [Desulfuromonas soudanensis]